MTKTKKEVFLPVPIDEYSSRYEIGSNGTLVRLPWESKHSDVPSIGRNKSLPRRVILPWVNKHKHVVTRMYDRTMEKYQPKLIHQLVAMAFVPNPDKHKFVVHKDGNRQNNHFKNLEWVNDRGVGEWTKQHGLLKYRDNRQKINYGDAVAIRRACANGASQMSVAKKYGLTAAHVNNIVHYRTWKTEYKIKRKVV